jgi:hypothetical protein
VLHQPVVTLEKKAECALAFVAIDFTWLRAAVSDLMLEKLVLKEVASGDY